jgi:hypothetical protein
MRLSNALLEVGDVSLKGQRGLVDEYAVPGESHFAREVPFLPIAGDRQPELSWTYNEGNAARTFEDESPDWNGRLPLLNAD